MNNIQKRLHDQLEKRHVNGNLRTLKIPGGLVDFSSNDYLGLSSNRQIQTSIAEAYEISGRSIGSTGSRLLTGNSSLYLELESKLANFFEAPAALLFNSGYMANLALLSTVPQRGDTILYDQEIHTCVKDGARLSQANFYPFRHNDPEDLKGKLERAAGNKFVVIESLYSMEGDYSPVNEFICLCEKYDAALIIDEAHTTGWAGPNGKGWIVQQKLQEKFLARVYTFGKGLGAHGACVAGSKDLIDYLINFSRPFIYTTALPSHNLISIKCAVEFIEKIPLPGNLLLQRVGHYLEKAKELRVRKSLNLDSPIQWILVAGNKRAIALSEFLREEGFEVRAILSPTVAEGKERLRVCIHSFNSMEEISELVRTVRVKV